MYKYVNVNKISQKIVNHELIRILMREILYILIDTFEMNCANMSVIQSSVIKIYIYGSKKNRLLSMLDSD